MTSQTRIEHDLLGEKAVPADAYYGVQTARGLENFHISGVEPPRPRQLLAVHERRLPDGACTSAWPSGTWSSWRP